MGQLWRGRSRGTPSTGSWWGRWSGGSLIVTQIFWVSSISRLLVQYTTLVTLIFAQDTFSCCTEEWSDLWKVKPKRVVKTTRLSFEQLESWIQDSDIKVKYNKGRWQYKYWYIKIVHLIRDPRAILNSVSAKAEIWLDFIHNSSLLCRQMESDSLLASILPVTRYL